MIAPIASEASVADRLADAHAAAFDRPWSADDIEGLTRLTGAIALAEERAGRVEGFILARANGDEAEILTLAVRPERRREGLGSGLIEAAAAAVENLGAEALWLEVAADNAPALALYGQTGFVQVGRRRGYYHVGPDRWTDAIVMRRPLNSRASSAYSP